MQGAVAPREPRCMDALLESLKMAGLAVVSVGLWTLRVAITARGRRLAGSLTAGVEAIVFLLVFSRVAADLQAVERLIGYALGVAVGSLAGMYLDERLSAGQSEIRLVTEGLDLGLVRALQDDGWPVTWVHGHGPLGDVTISFVAVDDNRLPTFLKRLEAAAPQAFWTTERLRSARAGTTHPGWNQVGDLHRARLARLRGGPKRVDPEVYAGL